MERAQAFATKNDIPRAYGTYEGVCSDAEVEIVYVGALHPQHKVAAMKASEHGKAVLCEKPLAMNASDAEAMMSCARAHGTFFMEAMWTRYFPLTQHIRSIVRDGQIGQIVSVDARLGFAANHDQPRLGAKEHGASALLDVGIYPLALASFALGPDAPLEVHSVGRLAPGNAQDGADQSGNNAFDIQFASVLKYPTGLATIKGSFESPLENSATIVGTKGRIHWKNFWCPTSFSITLADGVTHIYDASTHPEFALPVAEGHSFNFFNSSGLAHEARYVQHALERGLTESEYESLDESLTIMKTLDLIAKQIGFNNY